MNGSIDRSSVAVDAGFRRYFSVPCKVFRSPAMYVMWWNLWSSVAAVMMMFGSVRFVSRQTKAYSLVRPAIHQCVDRFVSLFAWVVVCHFVAVKIERAQARPCLFSHIIIMVGPCRFSPSVALFSARNRMMVWSKSRTRANKEPATICPEKEQATATATGCSGRGGDGNSKSKSNSNSKTKAATSTASTNTWTTPDMATTGPGVAFSCSQDESVDSTNPTPESTHLESLLSLCVLLQCVFVVVWTIVYVRVGFLSAPPCVYGCTEYRWSFGVYAPELIETRPFIGTLQIPLDL